MKTPPLNPRREPEKGGSVRIKLVASLLSVALAFSGCGLFKKKKREEGAAPAKKEAAAQEGVAESDFEAFVGRLRQAVQARDMQTVAQMMTTDFAYVMGTTETEDRKGDGVFQYWDENGLWPELEGILSEKFVKKGEYMVAPPQFANPAIQYDGYRVGIKRVGASWKFVYFVNG